MKLKSVLRTVVILLLAFSQTAFCLKCYECVSETKRGICGTNFDSTKIPEEQCNPQDNVCYEFTIFTHARHYTTLRSCGPSDVCEGKEYCKKCEKDFCNNEPTSV